MIGSKDDLEDVLEVHDKIIDLLEDFFKNHPNCTLHPSSVFSGIYFYFLRVLPAEEREFLFDMVATMSLCSTGNTLRTLRDRKKFVQQCKKFRIRYEE